MAFAVEGAGEGVVKGAHHGGDGVLVIGDVFLELDGAVGKVMACIHMGCKLIPSHLGGRVAHRVDDLVGVYIDNILNGDVVDIHAIGCAA